MFFPFTLRFSLRPVFPLLSVYHLCWTASKIPPWKRNQVLYLLIRRNLGNFCLRKSLNYSTMPERNFQATLLQIWRWLSNPRKGMRRIFHSESLWQELKHLLLNCSAEGTSRNARTKVSYHLPKTSVNNRSFPRKIQRCTYCRITVWEEHLEMSVLFDGTNVSFHFP